MTKMIKLLACIWTLIVSSGHAALVLKIEQNAIELGGQLNISCDVGNTNVSGNRRWDRGIPAELLCYNGVPTNPEKYHEEQLSDIKYQLTVNNVTEVDMNTKYVCRVKFIGGETTVSTHDFYFPTPSADMIETDYDITENYYRITVAFHEVYPVPSCTVKLKSQLENCTHVKVEPNGPKYDVQLTCQSLKQYHDSCGSPVELVCLFGKTTYPIEIKNDLDCIGANEDNILLPVVVGVGVPVVLIIALVVLLRRINQLRTNRSNANYSQNMSMVPSPQEEEEL